MCFSLMLRSLFFARATVFTLHLLPGVYRPVQRRFSCFLSILMNTQCEFGIFTAPEIRDGFEMTEATNRPTDRSTDRPRSSNPHNSASVRSILVRVFLATAMLYLAPVLITKPPFFFSRLSPSVSKRSCIKARRRP